MSFRTVVITQKCKLSYKNDFLVVRGDTVNMIHLSEINTIIVDSTMVLITAYLLCELVKNKVKIIFCDETRNPMSEIMPYYASYHSSKNINIQTNWTRDCCGEVFRQIIQQKLKNQATLINRVDEERADMLIDYANQVQLHDETNREGHGAKIYFNTLFGKKFTRDNGSEINKALDYGYAIILSNFNKAIVEQGYLTQIGIHHKNEFNPFNLSCDFMEPYRILIDEIVKSMEFEYFDKEFKIALVDVLNTKISIDSHYHTVSNAIKIYVRSILNALEHNCPDEVKHFNYEE